MDAPTLTAAVAVAAAVGLGLLPWLAALECEAQLVDVPDAPGAPLASRGWFGRWWRALREPSAPTPRSPVRALALALAPAPAFAAFGLVPYAPSFEAEGIAFRGVVADLDTGVMAGLALIALALLGVLAVPRHRPEDARAVLAAAVQRAGYAGVLAFAALAGALMGGSLNLGDVTAAQDRTVPALGALAGLAGGELPAVLAAVRVPAWGGVLQPVSFALFVVALLGVCARAPFDAPERERARSGGLFLADPGAPGGAALLLNSALLGAGAAFAVVLFLGGWSLPFLPRLALLATLSAWLPPLLAAGVAFALHAAAFAVKLLAVVWLLEALRLGLPRPTLRRRVGWLWRVLLPLALLNLFVTAFVLLPGEC